MCARSNEDVVDEDEVLLSGPALAALQEFYSEQDAQKDRFEAMKAAAEPSATWSMDDFSEDWNASQFWYSIETATILADELLDKATKETKIAVVSAPSAFVQLKKSLSRRPDPENSPTVVLLEFDRRFEVFSDFVFYDFQQPVKLASTLKGQFDRILCDPPFLSEDCQTKTAITARWLTRESTVDSPQPRYIVCTGERMEQTVCKLYPELQTTSFEPQHTQGRLSNEFRCYANYASHRWTLS